MKAHECNPECNGPQHGITMSEMEDVVDAVGAALNAGHILNGHPALYAAFIVMAIRIARRRGNAPKSEIVRAFEEILATEYMGDPDVSVGDTPIVHDRSGRTH